MRVWVDSLLAAGGRLLAPAHCQYCGDAAAALSICGVCAAALPWNRCACPRCALPQPHSGDCPRCQQRAPAFDAAWCAFRMEPPIQQGIHGLKYRAHFMQARQFGTLMAQALSARGDLPQLLIPVPLHRTRLFRRGYNQALEIARALAAATGMPLHQELAHRIRATTDQIGTRAVQRRRNVRGAFAVDAAVAGRSVALLDDVMTTGATLDALAQACREAGATRIEAWAVARVA